jgi:sigma-B regulation protein RsbU (phosphoserine phosphatase)
MKKLDALPQEIDLASEVQQLLFPKGSPVCGWSCIGVKNRMATGLGGDYFEFITMPDDCMAVFLGDVTGHGMAASVVMSLIYGYIHHSTREKCTPLETIYQVNSFLRSFACRSEKYDYFFSSSLFFSAIDPDSMLMHYVNAGHVAPMVRRGDQIHSLKTTGIPLGFFDEPEMEMRTFAFEKGDRLLLYTDGITEAANAQGLVFGEERLANLLLSNDGDHLEFLEWLYAVLRGFQGAAPITDDSTAIVIDFHGSFLSP